jgi:hypothetical protein
MNFYINYNRLGKLGVISKLMEQMILNKKNEGDY